MSETSDHLALFDFIQRFEGRYPMLRYAHHSPNEANGGGAKVRTTYTKRDGSVGYKMVPAEVFQNARMGVRPGFPDWVLPVSRYDAARNVVYAGLVFELKAARDRAEAEKKLSDDQRRWMQHFALQGWHTDLFWCWTDAAALLVRWVGGDPAECGLAACDAAKELEHATA